jgi:hypothetical protein
VERHSKVFAAFTTVIRDEARSPGATPISAASAAPPIRTLVGFASIPNTTSATLPVPRSAESGTRLPSTSPGTAVGVAVATVVFVAVGVTVDVGVTVGVSVIVEVGVTVGVSVGVGVSVEVGVMVGVSVGV